MGLFGGDSTSRVDNTSAPQTVQGVSDGVVFRDVGDRSHVNVQLTDHNAIAAAASVSLGAQDLAARSIDASALLASQISSDSRGTIVDVISRSLGLIESERGRTATLLAADHSATAALLTAERATPEGDAFASVSKVLIWLVVALMVIGGAMALRRS